MKPVLYGTIVVGMLDAIDAIVIFGLRGAVRFSWPLFINGILIHVFGIGHPERPLRGAR